MHCEKMSIFYVGFGNKLRVIGSIVDFEYVKRRGHCFEESALNVIVQFWRK